MKVHTDLCQHTFNVKKQNIFFTSDTHFWHENILKFCKRPFESVEAMNDAIINNWNSVVKKSDIVFHCGDFAFCGSDKMTELLDRLNGHIYLILGNHDWKNLKQGYMKRFEIVAQQMYINITDGTMNQKIYLNHFPYLCYPGTYRKPERMIWQLFGHVHSGEGQTGIDLKRLDVLFPCQYDVGVDNNNYTPVSFWKVKEIIDKKIAEFNEQNGRYQETEE